MPWALAEEWRMAALMVLVGGFVLALNAAELARGPASAMDVASTLSAAFIVLLGGALALRRTERIE